MSDLVKRIQAKGLKPPIKGTSEWKGLVAEIESEVKFTICAAKKARGRNPGWPCESPPMPNGKCRIHGGKSRPAGPDHPRYKHGRYSHALEGTSLKEAYEEARDDPKLLELTEEIALLVARNRKLLEGLQRGESKVSWTKAQMLLTRAQSNLSSKKKVARERGFALLGQLDDLLRNGVEEYNTFAEYDRNTDAIRRLADTERKYREGLKIYLPPERANAMFVLVAVAARKIIPEEYLKPFLEEIRRARVAHGSATGGVRTHQRHLGERPLRLTREIGVVENGGNGHG